RGTWKSRRKNGPASSSAAASSTKPRLCRNTAPEAEFRPMGVAVASFGLLADAVSTAQSFVAVFIYVYILLIFVYILMSWFRLPYSLWLNRIQKFLYDVCEPYLGLFRRFLPSLGPLDLSPFVATIVLIALQVVLVRLIGKLD